MSLISGSGRSPGEGDGNPLQYSCLGNPIDREAWWASMGSQKSQTGLSNWQLFSSILKAIGNHSHDFFLKRVWSYIMISPGGSDGKGSACNVGDQGWIPGLGRSPGEGNGYHSSILAWRIQWKEEPGRLQPMGSQRVRHNWVTNTASATHIRPFRKKSLGDSQAVQWLGCRALTAKDQGSIPGQGPKILQAAQLAQNETKIQV